MNGSIKKYFGMVIEAVSWVSYIGIVAVMLLISVDVALRFILNMPIMGSYELVERIEMCLVFASFAYTNFHHGHVHVSMLIMRFPGKVRLLVYALTEVVCGVMAAFVAYAAVLQARTSAASGYTTGVLFIPLYPFFWVEAVCMFIFALALFWEGAQAFTAMFDKDLAQEIESSWN